MKDGYLQIKFEGNKYWQFIIAGFSDNDCRVATGQNSYDDVPIDDKNRITINGRKYDQLHWYH